MYLVEGETEEKLIECLKTEMQIIYPGKVRKCNVVQTRLKAGMFIRYGLGVSFAVVFDTDTNRAGILRSNLELIRGLPNCAGVICIPQVKNLEDELVYACKVGNVCELTGSRSVSDFKRDFLRMTAKSCKSRLEAKGFDISRIWVREAGGEYRGIMNEAYKIKKVSIV